MKFFSNEAARQGDEAHDDDRARERAQAENTVPQQRAGSPWSDAPGDTRDDSAETARVVDFSRTSEQTEGVRDDADRTVVIDNAADRRDAVATDRRDDTTDRHDDTTDRMADATSDSEQTADLRTASGDRTRDENPVDLALDDNGEKRTTTYGPDGTVTTEERAAIRDEGTFESPAVVEPATEEPVDKEPVAEEPVAAAPVPEEKKPAPATPDTDRFFPEGDDVADRFRDIQLRFVDGPKDATAEAAALVDEALDKLTAALKSRRNDLASNSDETENLRVELRGYRELLNRILSL